MTGPRRRQCRKKGSTAEISLCCTQLRCHWNYCTAKNKNSNPAACGEDVSRAHYWRSQTTVPSADGNGRRGKVKVVGLLGRVDAQCPHKYEAGEVKHTRLNVTGHQDACLPAVNIDELEPGAATRNA
ncbi:hypothetical protein TcCL_NonESM10030 [Trypanosoma cruzi]|nr:hypothetical protein TcCL_NonESM10030 [Trypanosoma cruzi]